jgi:crotonobetainyl-CoA:carnitine CoA-transferase CaiB-like acyl-CoA transferase
MAVSSRPLEGITVVTIEQAVAAPFATRQLADLGARVIKIERPAGGDFARGYDTAVNGISAHFVWLNRSKKSLTLDLKQAAGIDILHRLLEHADVFVQNLAPGAADRLGAGSTDLRSRYPRLITCNISGYGADGPYASKKAYDLLIQSEVGLLSITGTQDTPCRVGISIADIAAGMYAYSAILTALFTRTGSFSGTVIDISLFDALGEWMGFPMYHAAYSGALLPRSGPNHISIAPYGPFPSAEGASVYLSVQNAGEWRRFCAEVLRLPHIAEDERFQTNERRVRHREALHALINEEFRRLPLEDIVRRLDDAGIANARMNSLAEFIDHPQLTARDRWSQVGSAAGPIRALRPPVTMEGVEPVMDDVPALGQHSREILAGLGVGATTIDAWVKEGVI